MNWMMVLGSTGWTLARASSCLAGGGDRKRVSLKGEWRDGLVPFVPFTSQSSQGVEAALLLAGEEAVAIQEVGPGHLDGLEGVGAVLPQSVARAAAGFDHPVVVAGRGDHGAAHQAYLGGALPVEQAVDDAQQQVLGSRLRIRAGAVPQDVGEDRPGEVVIKNNPLRSNRVCTIWGKSYLE